MISKKEALEIVKKSLDENELNEKLEEINNLIIDASKRGIQGLTYQFDTKSNSLIKKIIEVLKKLGYEVYEEHDNIENIYKKEYFKATINIYWLEDIEKGEK